MAGFKNDRRLSRKYNPPTAGLQSFLLLLSIVAMEPIASLPNSKCRNLAVYCVDPREGLWILKYSFYVRRICTNVWHLLCLESLRLLRSLQLLRGSCLLLNNKQSGSSHGEEQEASSKKY